MTREVSESAIKTRLELLNQGSCYINNGYFVFKLFGSYYSSNTKRKSMYSMDDRYWHRFDLSLINKLYLILTNKVRKLNDN